MNSTHNKVNVALAAAESVPPVARRSSRGRKFLIGIFAAAVMFLAAPVAANAAEGLSFSNTVNTTLNGGTLNFGSSTQLALPAERTIFLWSNTTGTNRRYGVNIDLTGTAYEFNRLEGGTVAASRTCTQRVGSSAIPGQNVQVVLFHSTSNTSFKSCGIVLRLKAGIADGATYNSTISYNALNSTATGCAGANCINWSSATQTGNGTLTGEVVANVNSGLLQNTAGNAAQPSYDYGSNGVGTSTPYTFTLRNTGNTTLTNANSQTVTGLDPADFVRSSSCPATLAPNATCTIQVNFEPSVPGARSATLNVNTGNAGTISSSLTGTGLVPTFIPKIQDTAGVTDLTDYAFPASVGTGEPLPPTYTFTLRNEGNSVLEGTNLQAITGADADDFSRSSTCPVELNPNATCQITITFSPNDPGAKTASLDVNTTNGGTVSTVLTGTAVTGVFETTVQNTAGDADLSDYTFPDTIALASTSYVFTIRNTGNVNLLNVGTQTITGDDADQFSRSTSCGGVLAPGATCTVTVNYNPNRVEAGMTANLNVNPSNGGSTSFPLTATSLTPSPQLSVRDTGDTLDLTSRAFTANLGSNQAYVFTIKNTGDSLLSNVNTQSVTGANAAEFTRTSTCGATLLPGASCTTTVTFVPQRAGTRRATLNITPSNPIVSPAARSVSLVGEATGISIRNDVTDNIANTGSQKRWLESVSLAPGGTLPSDTVRVAFEVDAGTANEIAGVDILGNTTTNDTVPTGTFQDIASLTLGNVSIQRKPGSNQALVVARVPLSSTNMGVANGSFGFSTGTDILLACLGGSFENTNRRLWFRVRASDGSTSATVGSVVRMHNQQFACPNNQGPNLSNQRILEVGDTTLPNNTPEAVADKNEPATFQFNTRAKTAGALGGSAGTVDGINWRIRNVKTGDMFRIVNGVYTACADPCTADANFTSGGRFNFPTNAAGVQQLSIPGIPSRGRWVVEASPQGSDENNDSFFHLGTLRINDRSGNSPTLTFGGTLGARPDSNEDYTISATVADPADPASAFDTQAGRAQVIEWDLNGDTSDGADGEGFEVRGEADSSGSLTAEDLVQEFSTVGKTPGPYTIRARVTDNGSTMASDLDSVSRIFVFNTTINAPPVGTTETINLEADDTQPRDVEFRATDADDDPYRVSITPNPGNDGSLGGSLNGPIGDNTKPYTWPATYTGTDIFDFITTDDKNGISGPATLTVKVRPNTTIDTSTIAGALLNPDEANPATRFLGSTTDTEASFEFSSPQNPVVSYECRHLNDGNIVEDWAECSDQVDGDISLSSLEDGLHRLEVRAINADGDADGTPAFRTWRVDNTAPNTEVRVGPVSNLPNQQPRMTNDTTPSYIFKATDAERSLQQYVTYECRVLFGPEDGVWQACGSPSDTQGSAVVDIIGPTPDFGLTDPLADGTYSIEVRATDEVGNLGPVMLETFKVDTGPPITALASGPEGLINTRDLEYVLSSTEGQSTFTCKVERVDPGPTLTEIIATGPCPGPAADGSRPTFTVPTDGNYVLTAIATDPATNPDPSPLEVVFEVDATEPTTTLDPQVDYSSGPTLLRRTQSRRVDVTFTGADSRKLSGFQCRIDSVDEADWNLCQSVQRFSGLSDGDHVLEIRSRDEAGNFDSTPEMLEWTVDRTPPVTSIDVAPDPVTNDSTPEIEFSVNEAASSECRLDAGPWTACSSPIAVDSLNGGNPLADGQHSFSARSTDLAGNVEVTTGSATWTVDTSVPVVEFTSKPNLFVPRGDASFGWSVTDGNPPALSPEAESECSLDGAPFEPCDRSLTVSDPDNGPHTLIVRATDQAGNVSADASYTFEVLGSPPAAPSIDNADPVDGTITRLKTAGFAFSHPDENEGSFGGFECRIDEGTWTPCESPVGYQALSDGAHKFEVRVRDVADNLSPAVVINWEVQSGAPVTTINSGPSGTSSQTAATFTFSSDKAGSFECRIDGAPWAACSSPLELTELADGDHSVRVRAVSSVAPIGVKDPTPPQRDWTVDTVAPDVAIDSAPAGAVVSSNATVTFSSTDSSAAFQCKLGSGLFDACSSPLNLTGLEAGEINLTVRATDAAGNLSETPATALWTVENPRCPEGQEGTPPDCTDIPPVEGPGINATLTSGELSLAALGAVPLPAELATLNGKRASDGRWFVPQDGVSFESVTQTIPDVLGPGTNVDVIISISATGAGRGTLPSGGGAATFVLPVRADVQARLGPISVIPEGTECSLKPVTFNLTGTYDEAAKKVTLASPSVGFPKVTGCATFKETIDSLLELPRNDIALSMEFDLEDVVDACPDGQTGTPPNCVTPESKLTMSQIRAPKQVKSGKPITLSTKVSNTGNAAATGVKVCLSSPTKLVKGKAQRCKTVSSIAAGRSVTVKFKVNSKRANRSAKAKFRIQATWKSGGKSKTVSRGHVTVLK